jgi:hypothetical protein
VVVPVTSDSQFELVLSAVVTALTVALEFITMGSPMEIDPDAVAVIVPPDAEGAVLCHVVPLLVRTFPLVPGATT